MVIRHRFSLSMVGAVFSMLLFLQSPGIFASGVVLQSKDCAADHLAYTISDGPELYYINGILVDRVVFCKALHYHYANHCVFEAYSQSDYCGLDLLRDEVHIKSGRKLLQKEVKAREPETEDLGGKSPAGGLNDHAKKVGLIAGGLVIMSCAIICPCIYRRRKATAHTVLSKEINSTDSVSSFDVISVPDKIPPSPARGNSPARVPPSPARVPPSPSRFSMSPKLSRIGSVHLTMSQAIRATRNFSSSLRIGEGGFGTVYKAQLEDGQVVAIKRAKKEDFDNRQTEFSSEVELLSKIDHRNLVKLLGYVDKGNERLIITEFVPNGTLREHLDGQFEKILDFNQRLEIAIDVAHGLTYLHLYAERQIIHRDVKSSNILLTESMRAKVADFGFAKAGAIDSDRTHVSTKVKGTVGYLDPEYMKTYQLTPKSDVYSFGILLLEILSGRRPVELKRPNEERVTLRWAFKKFEEGNLLDMIDPLMNEVVERNTLMNMFGLAFQCAAPIRNDRPDMKTVGEQLWAIRADYIKKSVRK